MHSYLPDATTSPDEINNVFLGGYSGNFTMD
jgi:hypothetical protein